MDKELAKLTRYVLEGRHTVEAHKKRISAMSARGEDTAAAERILVQFEKILAWLEKELRELEFELGSDQEPGISIH